MIPKRQLEQFEVLTFDCYGTLIDWETGILRALRPVLAGRGIQINGRQILELYAQAEHEAEQGEYRPYREVLADVMRGFGRSLGFEPSAEDMVRLPQSLEAWEPFPDTVAALEALKKRFKLAVVSNVDDDLFAHSARRLKVPFDWVITAQQVGAYKPSTKNFIHAIQCMDIPFNRVLHVAQSLYHDVAPAKSLGLATVWVNRRKGQEGFGATVPSEARPDVEVPDLNGLVKMLC